MKALVVMVLLLAAIVPPASGQPEGGSVGRVLAPRTHLEKRRIEIDADKMHFSGNGARWLRQNLAAMLRNRARNTGQVEVAVTGRQYRDIADSQDRIHDSGRYSPKSRRQVARGQMVAPTDQYRVTAVANISRERQSGTFPLGRNRVKLDRTKTRATVTLIIEPVVIYSGLSDEGYEVSGEAANSDISVSGSLSRSRRYGSYRTSTSNVEAELLEEAASNAVNEFIRRFGPPRTPEVPKSTSK